MIKLIIAAVAIAFVLGILNYEDDKVIIDTKKGAEVLEKGKKFVNENVEVK